MQPHSVITAPMVGTATFGETTKPPARRSARLGVAVVMVFASVASGAVGYYLGNNDRAAADRKTYPVWTDRVATISGAGPWISSLLCTYHLADGTTRRVETAMLVGNSAAAASAESRACPPNP
jgi:hypothetical protein